MFDALRDFEDLVWSTVLVLVAGLILLMIFVHAAMRAVRWRWLRDGHTCKGCGYDLRGLVSNVCSECAKVFKENE